MTDILNELLGFVDEGQLEYVEELREGLNRARLIQGNPEFEKDPQLNQTPRFLGGIGLSIDGLSEQIVKQGTIVTLDEKDYVAFRALETAVITNKRVRRFYADIEGVSKLACGTNDDGANAKGWRGLACKMCEFHPKNFQGDKKDGCKASIPILAYFPALEHVAVLTLQGASYMQATALLDQVGRLSRAFAQRAEVQARTPGLQRVNPWFFRTTLSAGPFEKGDDNNRFQRLAYTKAEQPFNWDGLLNTPETLKKIKEMWPDLEQVWRPLYVDHNPNAVMSLPTAEAVAALPVQSSAASKVVVPEVVPAVTPAQIPAALPATQPVPAAVAHGQAAPAASIPGVQYSQVAIDDIDPLPAAVAPAPAALPLMEPMGF